MPLEQGIFLQEGTYMAESDTGANSLIALGMDSYKLSGHALGV